MNTDYLPHRAPLTAWRVAGVAFATLLAVVFTASLGVWQLQRAQYKTAIQTVWSARASLPALSVGELIGGTPETAPKHHYRQVQLRGHWVADKTVFLDNRQMNQRVGFEVITPLQLEGQTVAVLVRRGWVARSLLDRSSLPPVTTPSGSVEVHGVVTPPPARLYEFKSVETGLIRQNLGIKDYGEETGLKLLPISVQQNGQESAEPDGLLRRWAPPAVDIQKHHGYAFQWFALCALVAGLYVWFQLIQPRRTRCA
jgi:surfeit locus 1 family protein